MNVSIAENVRMSLQAIWINRFRSLLTILGIVIGITTVVSVSSMLTGLRTGIVDLFQSLGPDNIFVNRTSGDPAGQFVDPKEARRRPVTAGHADFIQASCFSVADVGMTLYLPLSVQGRPITLRVQGAETENISVTAVSANMSAISPRDFQAGRPFTQEEDRRSARVMVIGPDVAEALFPAGDAVGRAVWMDGAEYTVVGVYEKAKGGFLGENRLDTSVVFPLGTARIRYPQLNSVQITAKARPGRRAEAFEEIEAAMRSIRQLASSEENDFTMSTPDQIIQQFDNITGMIGVAAVAISALGLLVGGIGVMNIMLMSVTERTREIGVRKAIGARRRDIVGQFLVEAVSLTGVGGLLGIVAAVGITALIGLLVPSLPSTVSLWALTMGLLVSVAVGVFFGVWPAAKAAALDPVDALRYE